MLVGCCTVRNKRLVVVAPLRSFKHGVDFIYSDTPHKLRYLESRAYLFSTIFYGILRKGQRDLGQEGYPSSPTQTQGTNGMVS